MMEITKMAPQILDPLSHTKNPCKWRHTKLVMLLQDLNLLNPWRFLSFLRVGIEFVDLQDYSIGYLVEASNITIPYLFSIVYAGLH